MAGAPGCHPKCIGTFIVANFTKKNLPLQNKIHDNYQEIKGRLGSKKLLSNQERKDSKTNNNVMASLEL